MNRDHSKLLQSRRAFLLTFSGLLVQSACSPTATATQAPPTPTGQTPVPPTSAAATTPTPVLEPGDVRGSVWGKAILEQLQLDPLDPDARRILNSCTILLTAPDGTAPDYTQAPSAGFLKSIALANLPQKQEGVDTWIQGEKCLSRNGEWAVFRNEADIVVLRHSEEGSQFKDATVDGKLTIVEASQGRIVRTVEADGQAWRRVLADPTVVDLSGGDSPFSTRELIGPDTDTPEKYEGSEENKTYYGDTVIPEMRFDREGLRLAVVDDRVELLHTHKDGVRVSYYREDESKWATVPWDSLEVNMGGFHLTVDQGTVYSEFVPILEQHNIHRIAFNPDNPEVVEDMGRLVTTYLYLAYHEQHPEDGIGYEAFVKDPGNRSIILPVKDEAGQIVPATIELSKLKRVSLRTATKGDLFISFQSLPYGKKFFARFDFDPTQGVLTLTQKLNMPTIFGRWDSYPDDYFAGDREGMVKILAPQYTSFHFVLSTMMLAKQRYLDYVPETDLRDVYEANESTGYQLSKFTDGPYRRLDPEAANYGLQTKQVENQEWTDYGYANVELALRAYNETRSWGRGV